MAGRTRIAVVVLVVALAGCNLWSQDGGGPARTGYNAADAAWTTANANSATIKWRTDTEIVGAAAISNGVIAATTQQQVRVWSTTPASCNGALPTACTPRWSTAGTYDAMFPPVIGSGRLFTIAVTQSHEYLLAYDVNGVANCTAAVPATCTPLWSADLGAVSGSNPNPLTTVGDHVVVRLPTSDTAPPRYDVFDAVGTLGCDRATHSCAPLFAFVGSAVPTGALAADGTHAFVPTDTGIDVFDLAGKAGGCNPSCLPVARLSMTNPQSPAVANGRLFVTGGRADMALYAFDATLRQGCVAGSPTICHRLWQAPVTQLTGDSPVVAAGRVLVMDNVDGSSTGYRVDAFDAAGIDGCDAATTICAPLRRYSAGASLFGGTIAASANLLLLGASDVPGVGPNAASHLFAFDLTGATNCTGDPLVCAPVATIDLGAPPFAIVNNRLSVASGLVTVPRSNTALTVVGLP